MISKKIKTIFNSGSERSRLIKKNIIASFGLRLISILCSLMVVPITINYVNPERYGIWLTLSSIVVWLSYFDFGFAHGFRNRFAEAIAKDDHELAQKYVSTTYAVLTLLFAVIMLVTSVINYYLNWSDILHVNQVYNSELRIVFQILILFFCVNIVAEIFTTLLTAYQRPALSAAVKTGGYVVSLLVIYVLTLTTQGNLELLAYALSGVPCLVTLVVSIVAFKKKRLSIYAPTLKSVDFSLTKNIVGMGGQFFLIMLCILLIFQFQNIIISRELGAEQVTLYNVTYKIFGIVEMVMMIILTPIWSAYTEAYTRKDFAWMKNSSRRLEQLGLLCIPALFLLWIVSPFLFEFWLGNSVLTSLSISAVVAFYILCRVWGNIYMYQINGTGKLRMQLLTYAVIAIFAIPMMILLGRAFGLMGIVMVPSMAFLAQTLIMRIQLLKIISGASRGWWNK